MVPLLMLTRPAYPTLIPWTYKIALRAVDTLRLRLVAFDLLLLDNTLRE